MLDGAAFDAKLEAARAASCVDFGLWGGLVPGNLDRLEELAERGVIGFKAFMSNSGIDEFAHVDDVTLYEGMAIAARLGLPVAVHAENDALTARALGPTARDWFASRPVVAELEAISRAILFAEADGLRAARRARLERPRRRAGGGWPRARGRRDLRDLPALPVPDAGGRRGTRRDRQVRAARAWRRGPVGRLGDIDFVTSDHSPSSPELKEGEFGAAWGGIAGAQSTLELLLGARRSRSSVRCS